MAWRSSNVLYTGHSATASKPIRRTSNLFQYKQQHKQQQHSNKRSKSKSNNNHHHQGAPPPFLCSSVFVSPWCDLPACAVRGSSVVVVVGSGVVVVVVVTCYRWWWFRYTTSHWWLGCRSCAGFFVLLVICWLFNFYGSATGFDFLFISALLVIDLGRFLRFRR